MNKKLLLLLVIAVIVYSAIIYLWTKPDAITDNPVSNLLSIPTPIPPTEPTPTSFPLLSPPPIKTLSGGSHSFQTFNNCGPAALSMALSYYGINVSQNELGLALRPYQNPQGDNDDKSVTLEELAEKSKEYGLIPYHRPNGNESIIKMFIAYDIPVITRTLLNVNDDIGHYRVIKGYDDSFGVFVQDDSLQGKDLRYSYSDFNSLWKQFSYEYLALVPPEKKEIAVNILGEDLDENFAWEKAAQRSRDQLASNPDDLYARFNLSIALYNTGKNEESIAEFEIVENRLPFRTLWYQIEPIEAYYAVGNYEKVFELTDKIINNHNRAFSELYIIRARIYEKQGNTSAADGELEKARIYNANIRF